jgi:hypothetical protein
MARRGIPLGYPVRVLLELLDTYGAAELEAGVVEALSNDVPHPHAVRHLIEKKRKREGQGPCLPLPLPPDPRLREITVTPGSLKPYDLLKERDDDEQEPA